MGGAITEVLPFAVGVAISPVPVVAVILVLFSARAKVNGPAFLVGWIAGLAAVSAVAYTVADASGAGGGGSATSSWVRLLVGVGLLGLAAHAGRRAANPRAERATPRWMASIDRLTPVQAVALAAALAVVNPKDFTLAVGAGAELARSGASGIEAVVGLVAFVVISSLTIAVPLVVAFAGGDRATGLLDAWKVWLTDHNDAVLAVLFLVVGTALAVEGFRGLRS